MIFRPIAVCCYSGGGGGGVEADGGPAGIKDSVAMGARCCRHRCTPWAMASSMAVEATLASGGFSDWRDFPVRDHKALVADLLCLGFLVV